MLIYNGSVNCVGSVCVGCFGSRSFVRCVDDSSGCGGCEGSCVCVGFGGCVVCIGCGGLCCNSF